MLRHDTSGQKVALPFYPLVGSPAELPGGNRNRKPRLLLRDKACFSPTSALF